MNTKQAIDDFFNNIYPSVSKKENYLTTAFSRWKKNELSEIAAIKILLRFNDEYQLIWRSLDE